MRRFALALTAAASVCAAASPALAYPYPYHGSYYNYGPHLHHGFSSYYYGPGPYVYYAPPVEEVYVQPQPAPIYNGYNSVYCTNNGNPFGVLLGGIAGGVLGHQVGRGRGNTAATVGGAIIGAGVGNALSQRCTQTVIRDVPPGMPVYWNQGNAQYQVVPQQAFQQNGRYCREYQGVATVGGQRHETYGTACMQPDGSWQIVN